MFKVIFKQTFKQNIIRWHISPEPAIKTHIQLDWDSLNVDLGERQLILQIYTGWNFV